MINIIVDLMHRNISKCFLENQRLYFIRRSEYSILRGNNRDENTFLEFTHQKDIIRKFFQMLEEKHAILFDGLVKRLEKVLSRFDHVFWIILGKFWLV